MSLRHPVTRKYIQVTFTHTHSQENTFSLTHTNRGVHSGHTQRLPSHSHTFTGEYILTHTHSQGSTLTGEYTRGTLTGYLRTHTHSQRSIFEPQSLTHTHRRIHSHSHTLAGAYIRVTRTQTYSQGSTLALTHSEREVHSGHIH